MKVCEKDTNGRLPQQKRWREERRWGAGGTRHFVFYKVEIINKVREREKEQFARKRKR
jgi:hypothetical protein